MSDQRPWVKLWLDDRADPTLRSWSPTLRCCWYETQLVAARAETPGDLTDSSGRPFSTADLSRLLGVAWHTAREFVEEAVAAGKLTRGRNGALRVAQWDERQASPVGAAVARSLAGSSHDRRAERDVSATPALQEERARGSGQKSDADLMKETPPVRPLDQGAQLPISMNRIEELCEQLRGSDQHSPRVLATVLRGMSEFELTVGLERTRGARPRSEIKYLVSTLKALRAEREQAA